MADEGRFVGNSVEELLVAIAEGLREAQTALNAGPDVDENGRSVTQYHLPYLDFNISVQMETRTSSGGRPIVLLNTPPAGASSQGVTSSISGRLVATPPGEGLPVPVIQVLVGSNIGGEATLQILVSNSAGERLGNQRIEVNIDDTASVALSSSVNNLAYQRHAGTRISKALLTTDSTGAARTSLLIDANEPSGALIVVVASVGPFNGKGVISAEVLG